MTRRYCIIGAGYCGLGVAKAFRDHGIPYDCFDRNSDIGGNWLNGVYDSTHIISSRDSTQYTDFPMPRDYPDFPSAAQVLAYLRSYADEFALKKHIQFNTEIEEATPLDPTGMKGWRVRFKTAQGETEERIYAGVIVANGHHWSKRIPQYPGNFTGKVFHSKDYKKPADFEGARVLVVGAGNSGCDIAVEAALSGRESSISMRRGYYFLPKSIFGVPTAEFDKPWLPFFAQKAFLKTVLRVTNGPNTRYGMEDPDHELFDHHPIVNSQLMYFIRHGRVAPKPDIEKLDGKKVHFKDGTHAEVDTLVWSTGFNVSFPFLDPNHFEWDNGIPKRVAGMLAQNLAGLYIFGLGQPRGGAGPLITSGARLLSELILAQETMDHPIALDLAKVAPASSRMLFGVNQAQREIRFAHHYIRWISHKSWRKNPPKLAAKPRPRNPDFEIDAQIPKHWISENAVATHIINSLNLLFPEGERFFIRSLKPFLDQLDDPTLKARSQAFMAQEFQHGRSHEQFIDILRSQGFELDGFMKWYERIAFKWIEGTLPPKLNLAVTAAVEHFTAAFAELALETAFLESFAHPGAADLFRWHAAEEIEHKSVAYDVLQSVAPGYARRMAGLAIATATLGGFWFTGTALLLRQDKDVSLKKLKIHGRDSLKSRILGNGKMARALLQYMKPGFHPLHNANSRLAEDTLSELSEKYKIAI